MGILNYIIISFIVALSLPFGALLAKIAEEEIKQVKKYTRPFSKINNYVLYILFALILVANYNKELLLPLASIIFILSMIKTAEFYKDKKTIISLTILFLIIANLPLLLINA